MIDRIKALIWWLLLDGVTAEYIAYRQPEESLLIRYLTRRETTAIPWDELDKIELELPIIQKDKYIEGLMKKYSYMPKAERLFYFSRLSQEELLKLSILRSRQEQEKHEAWLKEFLPDTYELIMKIRNKQTKK